MIARLSPLLLPAVLLLCSRPVRIDVQTTAPFLDSLASATDAVRAVDFGEITSFRWDSVYVLQPYTPEEHVNDILSVRNRVKFNSRVYVHDGLALIVFVRNRRVVAAFEHDYRSGDFGLLGTIAYHRNSAVFQATSRPYGDGTRIYFVDSASLR